MQVAEQRQVLLNQYLQALLKLPPAVSQVNGMIWPTYSICIMSTDISRCSLRYFDIKV